MQHSFELVHLEMYAALKQLHIETVIQFNMYEECVISYLSTFRSTKHRNTQQNLQHL